VLVSHAAFVHSSIECWIGFDNARGELRLILGNIKYLEVYQVGHRHRISELRISRLYLPRWLKTNMRLICSSVAVAERGSRGHREHKVVDIAAVATGGIQRLDKWTKNPRTACLVEDFHVIGDEAVAQSLLVDAAISKPKSQPVA